MVDCVISVEKLEEEIFSAQAMEHATSWEDLLTDSEVIDYLNDDIQMRCRKI